MADVVISDLGNVVVSSDKTVTTNAVAKILGLQFSDVEKILFGKDFISYETGLVSTEEFYNIVSVGLNFDGRIFREQFWELWTMRADFNEAVLEFYRALAQKYTLFALSDNNPMSFEKIRPGLEGVFRDFVLSHKVGFVKPSPEIYIAGLKLAGCLGNPGRVVYVDDKPEFVEAAVELGMKGVSFNCNKEPWTALEEKLYSYGVRV